MQTRAFCLLEGWQLTRVYKDDGWLASPDFHTCNSITSTTNSVSSDDYKLDGMFDTDLLLAQSTIVAE
jgi:hypothetical protein